MATGEVLHYKEQITLISDVLAATEEDSEA